MRKKHEVTRELEQERTRMNELLSDKDKRDEFRSSADRVSELVEELNAINLNEAAERAAATAQADQQNIRDVAKNFSFAKFIREASGENGSQLTGVEAEMAQEAEKEAKRCGYKLTGVGIPSALLNSRMHVEGRAFDGQNVTTPADGGYTVTSQMMYQEALRNRLILTQAGATYMGGLVNNIDLIQGEAITMGWLDENAEGSDTKKQFSKVSVNPMRCFVNVPISKQLTIQSNLDIDRVIINDIMASHAELLETAAINGTGLKQPTGVLNTDGIGSVAIGDNGGPITFKKIVDLETAITIKNADVSSMAYVTNAKVRGEAKTTLKSANVAGYIWEGGEMNGYRALASNLIPSDLTKGTATKKCSALIFGDWSNLWIMGWGGLDLIVDPYTMKKFGAYEVTLNAYHNIFIKRKEAFAAIKDITIA